MQASRIDDIAAEWAARLDREPLSPEDRAQLEAWLARDIRHQGAFARARAVFASFDKARALGADYDPQAFADAPPAPGPSRRAVWAAAAGVVALGGGGLLAYRATSQDYRTDKGEMRRVPLPDGSTAALNTQSRLLVDYADDARAVRLAEGEALFTVQEAPSRPFMVRVDDLTVRAQHASFSVRRRARRQVEIMVCDGWVELLRQGRVVQRISGGGFVAASPAAPLTAQPVSLDEQNRRLAWREGMVAFHGETLEAAATEFTRYADARIIIDDPAVAHRTVVGLFVANDPVNFAHAVAESFGLKATPVPGGVRLSRPDSA